MKHSYAEQHPDVDELVNSHSELVRKIAWQIHGRARHITEIEDIIQIGYTGLIVAAQNYTPLDGAYRSNRQGLYHPFKLLLNDLNCACHNRPVCIYLQGATLCALMRIRSADSELAATSCNIH